LTELPSLEYEEIERVQVAQLTFAFRNNKMMDWLAKRGDHIRNEEWEKLDKINDEITQGIKN
jgi:hypothetical protein